MRPSPPPSIRAASAAPPPAGPAPTVRAALLHPTVIVSALGYFVDIYDLVLFSIVRVASLKSLGVPEAQLLDVGVFLLNCQMGGMLLGGILWGILGDKRGRLTVLFGSILVYSLANLANAFVTSTETYGLLRFLAGVGLAGELGAAVTLVSESLPRETRGYGTSFVAGFGVSGAILAAAVGELCTWQTAYLIGGVLGLALLVLRMRLSESGIFAKLKAAPVRRGDIHVLLGSWAAFAKYLRCILIGVPNWFVVGILITFSPEICRALGASGEVSAGSAILFTYLGLVFGDIGSGVASQWCRSRKVVIAVCLGATMALVAVFLLVPGPRSPAFYYSLCGALGLFCGYWALFVTVAAEQFGTDVRATVTTTVPNFVRGSVVLLTMLFRDLKPVLGLVPTTLGLGLVCTGVAFLALWRSEETFGKDLDYTESRLQFKKT